MRRLRTLLIGAVCGALTITLVGGPAAADDLTKRREQVKHEMAQTRQQLNESSRALTVAVAAVQQTEAQLVAARATLARTRGLLAVAQRQDQAMAARLAKTRADLAKAKAAVRAGQRRLGAAQVLAGNVVRDQYQQQTNLLPIAILLAAGSTADLQTRLQWSTTMFATTEAKIDRLRLLQAQLRAARARQAQLERQVAADRKAAAATLQTRQTLERRASAQQSAVTLLLARRRSAQSAAAADVAADKRQYAQLTAERMRVEKRIAARIAAAKAAAARRAAAERAAKIAAAKAATARRAKNKAERAATRAAARAARSTSAARQESSSSADSSSSSRSGGNAAHGFDFPVGAPITSAYGMRFHPILHYWKLHDGTDFGAGCGTPIRAPYPGRVAERYYNIGYGNRLMIDHGVVDGRFVTTGYNHAIRYTVSVGEHVSRGEVIGYVGTTGFSTGCHLHLMVWLDGKLRNPMVWF